MSRNNILLSITLSTSFVQCFSNLISQPQPTQPITLIPPPDIQQLINTIPDVPIESDDEGFNTDDLMDDDDFDQTPPPARTIRKYSAVTYAPRKYSAMPYSPYSRFKLRASLLKRRYSSF
ncbi:hypothetical protein DSO57_1000961 [Entomophthora muscae]|uniref:Uncharacterized protein n=2 Tax=Entomophthora muscae TaxID=34485 RepID=A0ACC2RDT6_9FUNG|nr:hypothetical protein DSO57_1037546 [Entomophthora muscae]KAJ9086703.1 hypothetical protein DSO57_1000961 [Entomophthora muscae]